MIAAVVGGNLQGLEAAYLAKKAGWEVLVIDRKPVVPAAGLGDKFIQLDITAKNDLSHSLKGVDLVIPAMENEAALRCLDHWARTAGKPFAFDLKAYSVSSSKRKSARIFDRLCVHTPLPWPACGFPVVAKPDAGSGSRGVMVFQDAAGLQYHRDRSAEDWVLQEFLLGPSYSIEVLGMPGCFTPLQVTDLRMDSDYDCKRVLAPTDLPEPLISDFKQIAVSLAEALALKGLMDVEVIRQDHALKVLEIDARLPSQTPTAVYWSTGVNMVQQLADLFIKGICETPLSPKSPKGVVYEHINVSSNVLAVAGEHVMAGTDALRIYHDFFGADEAITNYAPGRQEWVATLIVSAENRQAAWEKRNCVIRDIRQRFSLEEYRDPTPTEYTNETDRDQVDNR